MDSTVGDVSIVPGKHFVGGHPAVSIIDGYITYVTGSVVDARCTNNSILGEGFGSWG